MKAYITYNNYDRYEYSLWSITVCKASAKHAFNNRYKSEFINSGSDDWSYLYLVEVDISEDDYKVLSINEDEFEVYNILEKVDYDPDAKIIYEVAGGY